MSYLLNRLTLVIIALMLISGCEITGEIVQPTMYMEEDSKDISVYFCPRDDCEGKLSEFILSAEKYAYCAFFDLDLEKVKSALDSKFNSGVDVKLIVDTDNYKYAEELAFVKQDNRSAFMHSKFCIIDGVKISSGSMNPTENCAKKNNNNLIFIESETLANNYETEFNEMWDNGQFGKGALNGVSLVYLNGIKIENYFCPEDKCGDKIEDALRGAKNEIYFMTFSFTHDGIANVILLKEIEGVLVKGVFENRGAGSEYSKYNVMKYQGIDVKKDTNPAVMHHKVFIIDNSTVITGSFNPSNNADKSNDENVLIIHDKETALKYLEEFDYIWNEWSKYEEDS